jgi:tetratricopeptide (TPR) repeat protein
LLVDEGFRKQALRNHTSKLQDIRKSFTSSSKHFMGKTWQIGDQIEGRWEIFNILEGGAGVVYIVYDHAFRESFAAKTFRDEIFAHSPLVASRFEREALAWVRLDIHPNIAEARMVENIEGKPFLFLEYVSGGDLAAWVGTPRLTEDLPQVLRFAVQFCDGMIHALKKGIRAHRDIKPRNCLITADGILKVTDFGLAKLFEDDIAGNAPNIAIKNPNLSITTMGTCTHMAPEQFKNASRVDLRADIYSFGVMLFQMVSGNLPFNGENWKDLEKMHATQRPSLLSCSEPQLAHLIQTCLEKDPCNRFSDFTQLRERLSSLYQKVAGEPMPEPAQGATLTSIQWNNKGTSLDNLGMRKESLACYNSAIQLNSKLASAWFNKGVALFESGMLDRALACYERAIELDPKAEKAWSNKGVALKTMGKTSEAITCYDRALAINSRYPNAWVNKGVILRVLGKTEEALSCYERALRLNPKDEISWTNKGNILYTLGRPKEALACYERALALNSRLDRTWMNKGMALNALGKNEAALQSYSRAIQINPRVGQTWYLRGLTLMNAFQRFEEAMPFFKEAARLGSKEASEQLVLCQTALSGR